MSAPASIRMPFAGAVVAILLAAAPASSQRLDLSSPSQGAPVAPQPAEAQWRRILVPGTPAPRPPARVLSTVVLDEGGGRMVLFGGVNGAQAFQDVWTRSLAGVSDWTPLSVDPSTGPAPVRDHVSIYDPVRRRMLVFGGSDFFGSFFSHDVWALSLDGPPAWTRLTPSGIAPSGRFSHAGFYDPVRDRFIVFGGYDGSFQNDVWALSLSGTPTWAKLTPGGTAPPGLDAMTTIYDPVRDRVLVFGGWDGAQFHNEVWSLSLAGSASWSQLSTSGVPPSRRRHYAGVYDPSGDRLVIMGGLSQSSDNDDAWTLSLTGTPTWARLSPAGAMPRSRSGHRAIYDPAGDRLVMFGGYHEAAPEYLDDTWSLSLGATPTWQDLDAAAAATPSPRRDHVTVYDPVRDRLVVFGGWGGESSSSYLNDVWALALAGTPSWSQIFPAGPAPSARFAHTGIYDPVRDRLVVFGGHDGAFRGDVWALSLSGVPAWSEILPSGPTPVGRDAMTAIYDPRRDRMVVFSGWDGATYRDEVWALSLAGTPSWRLLDQNRRRPSARRHYVSVYDPSEDRMVISGGFAGSQLGDTWAYRFGHGDWSEIRTPRRQPTPRNSHRAVLDPVRERLVLFGGYDGDYKNDSWALSLDRSRRWQPIEPTGPLPVPRLLHTLTYDPVRDRALLFGGLDGGHQLNDTWALEFRRPVAGGAVAELEAVAPESNLASTPRFAVHGISPNPAVGGFAVELSLPGARAAELDVFDITGSLVQHSNLGPLGAGRHSIRIGRGTGLAPGVYLVRVACGSERRSLKAVVLR